MRDKDGKGPTSRPGLSLGGRGSDSKSLMHSRYRRCELAWDVRSCRHMEHRRQAIDVVGLIVQLTGFIVLISLFFPTVRRILSGFGLLAVSLSMLAVMGLMGFTIYRLITRQSKVTIENPFAPPGGAPAQTRDADPAGNDSESETRNNPESENAPDLVEPALRRRYPWRREMADKS